MTISFLPFRILSLFLALVFFTKDSGQAMALVLPFSPEVQQKAVKIYNSFSQQERKDFLFTQLSKLTPEEQKFYRTHQQELQSMHWPDVFLKDGVFSLTIEGEKLLLELEDDYRIKVRGKSFDVSPRNIDRAFKDLEQHIGAKRASLTDFIIPSAYALAPAVLIALMAVAIFAGIFSNPLPLINTAFSGIKCEFTLVQLADPDLEKANGAIQTLNNYLKKTDCSKSKPLCDNILEARTCWQKVRAKLAGAQVHGVDHSDRGTRKDSYTPGSSTPSATRARGQ